MNELTKLIHQRSVDLGYETNADIARAGGLTEKMVSEYAGGKVPRRMHEATAQKWATALRVPVEEIRQAAGMPGATSSFQLTGRRKAQADSLTKEQAEVVLEMIRVLGEANEREARNDHPDESQESRDELKDRRERSDPVPQQKIAAYEQGLDGIEPDAFEDHT